MPISASSKSGGRRLDVLMPGFEKRCSSIGNPAEKPAGTQSPIDHFWQSDRRSRRTGSVEETPSRQLPRLPLCRHPARPWKRPAHTGTSSSCARRKRITRLRNPALCQACRRHRGRPAHGPRTEERPTGTPPAARSGCLTGCSPCPDVIHGRKTAVFGRCAPAAGATSGSNVPHRMADCRHLQRARQCNKFP